MQDKKPAHSPLDDDKISESSSRGLLLRTLLPRLFKGAKRLSLHSFVRQTLTLVAGTTFSQMITIAISPLLTRIYRPEDFGIYGLYGATTAIIATFSTLRYSRAIFNAHESDAADVLKLSLLVNAIITLLSLVLACVGSLVFSWIPQWSFVIPIGVFTSGMIDSLTFWVSRKKRFKVLATNRVLLAFAGAAIQLGAGFFIAGPTGLFLGFVVSQLLSCIWFVSNILKEDQISFAPLSWKRAKQLASIFRDFPIYSLPADVLNYGSSQLPTFVFGKFAGNQVVGFFSFTQRILMLPITLIASAMSEVFRQRASAEYLERGSCQRIFIRTFLMLAAAGFLPFIVLLFFGPRLFSIVFGANWRTAGEYAQILCFMYYFKFTVSPLSYMFYIAGKQREDFFLHIYIGCSTALVLGLTCVFTSSVIWALWGFSLNFCLIYTIYFVRSYIFSRGRHGHKAGA